MFSHPLTDRAELRPLELRHAEQLYALTRANLDRLRPWFPWATGDLTPDDTRRFVEETVARVARNDGLQACLFLDGRLAGTVGFHAINRSAHRTTMGYWLAAEAEGRGLMTRAVSALLDHGFGDGFGTVPLNRVEINADPDNRRSRAIPERLGFTLESVRRDYAFHAGRHRDEACYVMLRRDWLAR